MRFSKYKQNDRQLELLKERRKENKCIRCGEDLDNSFSNKCNKCLNRRKKTRTDTHNGLNPHNLKENIEINDSPFKGEIKELIEEDEDN